MPRAETNDKDFHTKQAAKCRRQAATEADTTLKAELLVYAAEFEAKAGGQTKS